MVHIDDNVNAPREADERSRDFHSGLLCLLGNGQDVHSGALLHGGVAVEARPGTTWERNRSGEPRSGSLGA